MLYRYRAAKEDGAITEAIFEAQDMEQVLHHLAVQDLRPLTVEPLGTKEGVVRKLFGKISIRDKVFLTKYLALMLRVGTDLLSAVDVLIAEFDKPAMRNLLLEIRDNLGRGQPFYKAFMRYPKIFSRVFVNLIKAAEASGNLQQTFEELSSSLKRQAEFRSRIRSALVYPIILLVASFSIFVFLVTFALPRIAEVFLEGGISPPIFSRVVFGIGLFVNAHLLIFFSLFFLGIPAGVYFLVATRVGRQLVEQAFVKLPFLRSVHRDLAVQRFAATFSSLLRAGVPIIEAVTTTADVVGSERYRASLLRVARDGLSKGLTLSEAFRRETVFPNVVVSLVAVAEKAGHLEEVLDTLSHFYESSVDESVKMLVAILEPLLLLIMGFLVAAIALAIIVPIYQLTAQF